MIYRLGRLVASLWVYAVQRPRVRGRDRVPRTGPAILAINHIGFWEPVTVGVVVPRRLVYPAKKEWFTGQGPHMRALAWLLRAFGQVPVDRQGGSASQGALDALRSHLTAGEVVAVFPEGTRSPDGRLYRGHTGVARLAIDAQVPVIPVGVTGTGRHDVGTRVVVTFGEPLTPPPVGSPPELVRALTDEVMAAIQAITGQEYEDRYAADFRRGIPSPPQS